MYCSSIPCTFNPNVREPVYSLLGGAGNIHLIEPLNYQSFVRLMSLSTLILTDSGGIQEEAPSLGKPVLVMRDVTERPEALETGTAQLVGTDAMHIYEKVAALLGGHGTSRWNSMRNPYGDGRAAFRIVEHMRGVLCR